LAVVMTSVMMRRAADLAQAQLRDAVARLVT
jgi:hypothetical protein